MKIICLMGCRANPKSQEWTLGGHYLIEWPYIAACLSTNIGKSNTYISTNSQIIYQKMINQVGKDHWISRLDGLATDTATDIDWIQHALFSLAIMRVQPDIIVHLRATTPLIDPIEIDRAIGFFLDHPDASSMQSVQPWPESPWKSYKKDGDYLKPFMDIPVEDTNRPRQSFPIAWSGNGYIDIYRTSVIDTGVLYGDKVLGWESPHITEIDDAWALEINEYLVDKSPLWNNKFNKLVEVR